MSEDPAAGNLTRKTLLKAAVLATAAAPLLIGGSVALARDRGASGRPLAVTPDCTDGDQPTHDNIEGPYFKPDSPLRNSLVGPGTVGTPLTVSGYVFDLSCRPVAGALLDFWQADDSGAYDNTGFDFRGHQFTNADGSYQLTTIVPGLYPGRTRHIHVKAQAPGQPILTTQLYFPGEPRNSTDAYFDPALLMTVRQADAGNQASFDFVLNLTQPSPTPTPTQSHGPTPSPSPSGTAAAQPWAPDTAYQAGDLVTYGGAVYQCLQAHTSMTGWEPPAVPSLWQRL
ncbi:carbohydrate-binding protein [Kitasatospora viridis]|uniref:Carbohydrate binding protein n=1 Tax=Kitasatospora viridis TaxID=281105 RepID=A0A561UAA7_9ACTN|nr:carbohydrate-binding protein [Kitasatospora viridis]TWF96289.1 carbohydrate binding protein [Kitasatospora viridis]